MSAEFTAITTYFNPVNTKSLLDNYFVFAENLKRQNVNLLTVELAFNDKPFRIPKTDNVYQLRSDSICFQKERLINYGISVLPDNCKYFGWLDCDILFDNDNWVNLVVEKLQKVDIVQPFKKVYYLHKGVKEKSPKHTWACQGVIWDYKIHKNWLQRRINKELPFSHSGFGWCARRNFFDSIGLYDKNILGSGDTFLVDCFLDSFPIHNYDGKFNPTLKKDLEIYRKQLQDRKPTVDYIPVDIYHLWHGKMQNRAYNERHRLFWDYNFDPNKDIRIIDNVWEWSSPKYGFHEAIKEYFENRKEDE